ncbi:DNA methyltransferase [Mycoplasmopsis caviae]|uniref:DNA methyltransferase n=1 Tax=Mycoplasmopsis caviae TaxID=55603 RepID=A0A3P8KMB9_9BACT|nr:DNA methyltransferase [Mycoplasmopsis caviae]UUD35278.1 DNA methyltransferase [Mycoplasmopsis caviae]VDR41938.1 Uncharacterised protein [Mycoplasmopsis caviae]
MKKIRLFEIFSGIGSQYKALKNLEKELNFETVSMGSCDFYIDAIISYQIIHYGKLEPEINFSHNKKASLLSKFTFSSDSKNVVKQNYFNKMNEDKLSRIFPYLYSFVDHEYFKKVYSDKILHSNGGVDFCFKEANQKSNRCYKTNSAT